MRLALEQLEPEKDMENFVREYGTGNAIPEPPTFVNYANTDAPPVSASRIVTRPSVFARSTQRVNRTAAAPPDDDAYDDTNHAGVGAGGSSVTSRSPPIDPSPLSRSATQKSTTATSPRSVTNGVNGHVSPSREPQRRQSIAPASAKPVAGDPVDPTVSNTQLVIGDRTFDVDPNKDPQQQKTSQAPTRRSPPAMEQDPLVKQMAELSTAAAASGTVRRNTIRREPPSSSVGSRRGTADSLSTPSTTTSASAAPRDFRNSAEVVVGSYQLAQTPSRSASPNPPKAVMAAPPPPSVPPSTSNMPVEQVVSGYQRPFPGEPRSRANSYVGPPPVVNQNPEQGIPRPTSRAGYPGVGTQSLVPRPPSPARGPSPTAVQPYNRGPPAPNAPPSNGPGALHRGMSISHRPVTPTNPVGIALGPDGRVVHDMMVQPVRQASYPQPAPPPPTQPPQLYPGYHETSRALTHPQQQQPPPQQPPSRNDYAVVAANPYGGGGAQPYNYGHPPAQQHPGYNDGYHGQYGQAPAPAQPYNAYGHYGHQQSQSVGHVATAGQQRYVGGNTNNAVGPGPGAVYRSTSPGMMRRSPSPAARGQPPTGTYTDDGRPILFYGASALFCFGGWTCADVCGGDSQGAVRLCRDD